METLQNIDNKIFLEENLENITKICGEKTGPFNLSEIGNDPNFVFTNDPNYDVVVLFYSDGTKINVNSWIECANYVSGGWSSEIISNTNYEQFYFFFLSTVALSVLAYKNIYKKYVKK